MLISQNKENGDKSLYFSCDEWWVNLQFYWHYSNSKIIWKKNTSWLEVWVVSFFPHPWLPVGTKLTSGSLPRFSLFNDAKLAGLRTRRLWTFPSDCIPWLRFPKITIFSFKINSYFHQNYTIPNFDSKVIYQNSPTDTNLQAWPWIKACVCHNSTHKHKIWILDTCFCLF